MSIARHHAGWLSLVEVSGPFLSMPVLMRAFPQGMAALDAEAVRTLRGAYDQWADNQRGARPDPALQRAWVRYVLTTLLGYNPDYLQEGQAIPEELQTHLAEHGKTLRPDIALLRPGR